MATKTWKLGEYAQGGIITVTTTPNTVTVIGKQWDMSQGTRRSSNQSNAKEFSRKEFDISHSTNGMVQYAIEGELCHLTTSYYADQIMKWIKSKVSLK